MINPEFLEIFTGDREMLDLLEESISKKHPVMIYYKSKRLSDKFQTYIIIPVRLKIFTSKQGKMDLMLLAKQPSKKSRTVQFVVNNILVAKTYTDDSDEKSVGMLELNVNKTKSRSSFLKWGHFPKEGSDDFGS